MGAPLPLPAALHRLQAGLEPPAARGQRRGVLLARISCAGKISDPNLAPALLGKVVMVGVNKKRFWPTVQAIKERYYLKYRGGAGSSADYEE